MCSLYLREIRLVLSEEIRREYGACLADLVCRLESKGIFCNEGATDEAEAEIKGTALGDADRTVVGNAEAAKIKVENVERMEAETGGRTSDENLWITDLSDTAEKLAKEDQAVLAWLHDGNRQEDFGMCRYVCEDLWEVDEIYLDRVYRRCKGLPWEILRTKDCIVRETTVEDVDIFYQIYSDPSITRYMDKLYDEPEQERAYAQDYIDQVYSFYEFGIWTVVERESGEVIGRAGICFREGYEESELGFVIGTAWQGRGYATQVCREILRYAGEELGFDRVLAFVEPENLASLRVCEKLGMKPGEEVFIEGRTYEIYIWNSHVKLL